MLDRIKIQLGAVERTVRASEREGVPVRAVCLTRSYPTSIEDLWDALTNPQRLPRWFAAVRGDFHVGGRFQVEGNAGGQIVKCAPPKTFSLTWEIAGDVSWVDVVLRVSESESTRMTLTHTARLTAHWTQYGPGATGVGWELGLHGLSLHLADPESAKFDEEAFLESDSGKVFVRGSSAAWAQAAIEGGEHHEGSRAAAKRTAAFYSGESTSG